MIIFCLILVLNAKKITIQLFNNNNIPQGPCARESSNTVCSVLKTSTSFDQSNIHSTTPQQNGCQAQYTQASQLPNNKDLIPKKDKVVIPQSDYSSIISNMKFPSIGNNIAPYNFSSSLNKTSKIKDKNDNLKKSFTNSNISQSHHFNSQSIQNTYNTNNTLNTLNTMNTLNNINSSKDHEKEINLKDLNPPNFNFPNINSNFNTTLGTGNINSNQNINMYSNMNLNSLPTYGTNNNNPNSAKKKPHIGKISINSINKPYMEQNVKVVVGISAPMKQSRKNNLKKGITMQNKIPKHNTGYQANAKIPTSSSDEVLANTISSGITNPCPGSYNPSPVNNFTVNSNLLHTYSQSPPIPKINYINIQNNYINYSNRTTSHNDLISSMNKIGTFLKQQNKVNTPRASGKNNNKNVTNPEYPPDTENNNNKDLAQLKQLDELIQKIEQSTGKSLDETIAQLNSHSSKEEEANVDARIKKYGILFDFINTNIKEITELVSKKTKNSKDYTEEATKILENISKEIKEKKESRRNVRYNDLLTQENEILLKHMRKNIDDKDKLIKDHEVEDSIDHIKKIIAINNYTNKNKAKMQTECLNPARKPQEQEGSFLDSSVNSEFYINLMNDNSQDKDKEIDNLSFDVTNMPSYVNAKQLLEKEKLEETQCQFDGMIFNQEEDHSKINDKINIISNEMTYDLFNKSTERTRTLSVDKNKNKNNHITNNVIIY